MHGSRHDETVVSQPNRARQPFLPRHAVALAVHLPLTLLWLWLMLNAGNSDGYRVLWVLCAVPVLAACIWLGGACIQPWLDGANRFMSVRLLLMMDAALALLPAVVLAWTALVWTLVAWPTFFKRPYFLISWTTFAQTAGGALVLVACAGFYAWTALRLVWMLLTRERTLPRDLLGDLATPEPFVVPPELRRRGPPLKRRERERASTPRPVPRPTPPYHERPPELATRLVGGEWRTALSALHYAVGDEGMKARGRELGWPAFEWVLRAEPSRDEVMQAIQALPNLAAALDDADAAHARGVLERYARDTRSWTVRVIPRDPGDPDQFTQSYSEVAKQALRNWDRERQAAA